MSGKTISKTVKKLLPFLLTGGFLLTACINSDYKISDLDETVGISSLNFQLITCSTDTIKLSDVLDLDSTDCVVIMPDGDYVFQQNGEELDPTSVTIDKTLVQQSSDKSKNLSFTVPEGIEGTHTVTAEDVVYEFAYKGTTPEEVEGLDKVGLSDAEFSLALHFAKGLSSLGTIDRLVITLPSYMTLSDVKTNETYTINGSALAFTDVPTSEDLTLTASISEIDLTVQDDDFGSIIIDMNENSVEFDGNVHVFLTTDVGDTAASGTYTLESSVSMSDFYIVSATGRFNPAIDIEDLGDVDITGAPDFLTDGNVVLDLYNPQIIMAVDSDLSLGAYVSGTLVSIKDGVEIAKVSVPEMKINAGGTTTICICRTSEGVSGYDVVNAVPELGNLIRTIPDKITFSAEARADNSSTCEFLFGHTYTIQPSYSIIAPLAFGEEACIVYKDTLDGWQNDIKRLNMTKNSTITVTADIENRIPAYLILEAHAINTDGEAIDDNISVEVSNTIIASADGSNSAETPVTITITVNTDRAIRLLDGIVISAFVDASDGAESVVGQTLNSGHFLIAKNVQIKVEGKATVTLN